MAKGHNLEKKTLNFREGDWDYLESLFTHQGIGPSIVIRTLVSNYVDARRKMEEAAAPSPTLKVDL